MPPLDVANRTIELLRRAGHVDEAGLIANLEGQTEVLLRVPLPSHGRAGSYIDICQDLLEASYFCESLAKDFACGKLDRRYADHDTFYLLPVDARNAAALANALFRLQWAFNSPDDSDFEDVADSVRDSILEFEYGLPTRTLRYPEIVDSYLANRLGGAYFDFPEDLLAEEYSTHPERRFGFWRSPHYNGEDSAVLVSHDAWLIPPEIPKDEAFRRYQYFDELSLLNADLVALGDTATFLSEGTALTIPLQRVSEALACRRFTDNDPHRLLWPGNARYFVSEFKDFVLIELGEVNVVLFNVAEVRSEPLIHSVEQLLEKHRSETYSEPMIRVDWSVFDDEKFEELCYDLVYHNPRFDKATIRKVGKSRSRDGGRDIVAMTRSSLGEPPRKYIFQCKAISPDKSLTTSNLGSMADVIDQYGAGGYVVMTSGYIDATVLDRLDGIAAHRNLEIGTWSRFEIERFLARRPSLLARHLG